VRFARAACDKCAELKDEMVSKNNDCLAYSLICGYLKRMNVILLACVRMYYLQQPYEELKQLFDVHGNPPDEDALEEARMLLYRAVLHHEPFMSHMYQIATKEHRLYDNFMTLLFMIDAVQYKRSCSLDNRADRLAKVVGERDKWLAFYNAAICTESPGISDRPVPVLDYRVSQVCDAMYQLAAQWPVLPYGAPLLRYVELLRIRIGQLLSLTHGDRVHDSVQMRHCMQEPSIDRPDGEYQHSQMFLYSMSLMITDMCAQFCNYTMFPRATQAQAMALFRGLPWERMVPAMGLWIDDRCKQTIPDGSSAFLRDYLLRMALRPGEQKVYAREAGARGGLKDEASILTKYRKNEFDSLSKLRHNSVLDVLQRHMKPQTEALLRWVREARDHLGCVLHPAEQEDDPNPETPPMPADRRCHEPPEYVLCVVEIIELYTEAQFYEQMKLRDYVIFECDLDKRKADILHGQMPMLVQIFHYFHVLYQGVLYRFDSLILSVLGWLHILKRDFRGCLDGEHCDLAPWFQDLERFAGPAEENPRRRRGDGALVDPDMAESVL
jgi:hypothetical protein